MANTVSLCMICKNEEANIGKLMDEVCPVLEDVLIVDTGSTDKTLEILKEKQTKYPNLRLDYFKWTDNFSEARNFAFSKASASTDWMLFLDADDSISSEDLKKFKDNFLDDSGVDCWLLDYNYSFYSDGTPSIVLGRERFVRKSCNPTWIGAIHEVIDISRMRHCHYNNLKVNHMHQNSNKRAADPKRNLRILEKEHSKNPDDPRTAYYYGKELFDHCDARGIGVLEHYLTLQGKYYDDVVNCRYRLGSHYLSIRNHRKALDQAYEIYHDDFSRERSEGYFLFGAVEQDLKNYKIAIEWFQRCLNCNPQPPRVLNREVYTWHPWKRMAECYFKLNNYVETKKCINEVLNKLPNDQGILNWIKSLKTKVDPIKGSKIVEISTELRADSNKFKNMDCTFLPFRDEELDGLVVPKGSISSDQEVVRVLKPAGFLWVVGASSTWAPSEGLMSLGVDAINNAVVHGYVKVDSSLPTVGLVRGDDSFGPHRIRVSNVLKSAIRSGHRLVNDNPDVYFTRYLSGKEKAKLKVLDICEQLDKGYYEYAGINHADHVIVCSTKLAEHVSSLYPQKSITVINDHFELSDREWLTVM